MSAEKLKIALVITRANVGGAQNHVRALLRHLGNEVDFLLISGEAGYLTSAVDANTSVLIVDELNRAISPINDIRCVRRLRQIMVDEGVDLIHAHSSKAGALSRLCSIGLGVPVIYTAHGWPFSPGNPFVKRLTTSIVEFFLAGLTSKIITVSHYDELIARKLGFHWLCEIETIHNGIEDIRTSERQTVVRQEFLELLFLGRLVEQKNATLLIRTAEKLTFPYHLTIAGDGPELQMLQQMVVEIGIESCVTFAGEVRDIAVALEKADALVMTSRWEGLPLCVIEAMCAGRPVVATNVGGVSELIVHGETGYLCDPDDAQGLARSLTRLATNSDLRSKMGDAARSRYREKFAIDQMIEKIRSLYLIAVKKEKSET